MPEVSVAMILTDNLKLKAFKVQQEEIILNVEGDTDPNTLQKLRDHLVQSVSAHRTAVNDFIKKKNDEALKSPKKDRKTMLSEANNGLKKLLENAETKMQASADKFYLADERTKSEYQAGRIKFFVRLAWVPIAWIADYMIESAIEGVAGPVGWIVWLKSTADKIKATVSMAQELISANEEKDKDQEKLKTAISKIRAIKPPKKLEAAQVDALKLATKTFSARVLGLEIEVKKAATQLDDLLKAMDQADPPEKGMLAVIEDVIKEQIEMIEKLNDAITEGKKLVQSATDIAKNAETRATSNWTSYLGAVNKVWDAVVGLADVGMQITSFSKAAQSALKTISGFIVDAKAGD